MPTNIDCGAVNTTCNAVLTKNFIYELSTYNSLENSYGCCKCWEVNVEKWSHYFTIVDIRNSFFNWIHLLKFLFITLISIPTKEQGLHCFLFTKSLCYSEVKKTIQWEEWNSPLLLHANYVSQEIQPVVFLLEEPFYHY